MVIMNSPFTNFTGQDIETISETNLISNSGMLKSPLLDPLQLNQLFENKPYPEQFTQTNELNEYEIIENQLAPTLSTAKIGDITFAIADTTKANSEEFKEPVFSGNPLIIISPKDRTSQISKNFLTGEFAQAQAGKYKFNFARIDPLLVENLQKLRSFFGKQIEIVDGYYSPKYLKEVLKINDLTQINLNPHITGWAVKINVPGYSGIIKQIAIAAIVSCDKDINIGIGTSTMTLAVKQPPANLINVANEHFKRISSYIADEKIKVATYTFCVDVKTLLYDHLNYYEKLMHKAVSAFAVSILKLHYAQNNIPAELMNWEKPVRDIISLMHDKSITQNPNVILYCLAYSPFGNLFRYYFKDKSDRSISTVNSIINDLTTDKDRQLSNTPGNFIPVQSEPDKTRFIDYCRQRILLGKKPDGSSYRLVPANFFDWKNNPKDKNFLDKFTGIIKDVYFINRYHYDVPVQQSPVGGTRRKMELSNPNPDKPVNDFTGRYWAQFAPDHQTLHGRFLVINQAGNYIAGKFGGIFKKPVKNLRNTVTEFYGKIDEKGNVICNIYPQQTLILKKSQGETRLYLVNNLTDKLTMQLSLIIRSKSPVISNRIINSFSYISPKHQELLLTLAWVQPLPSHLKEFFESFKSTEPELTDAIRNYYHIDESRPSIREGAMRRQMSNLDTAVRNYLKLPPMFNQFANYYTKYYYSVPPRWSPGSDRETMSKLDWIKKMLEDYRDVKGTKYIEEKHKTLYDYFGVDTKTSDVYYQYKITLKLKAYGIGPFARSSGTITIENKTDYNKYQKAQKWRSAKNTEDFPVVLWNATLSLNPGRWLPKIATGETIEAEVRTNAFYLASDFSGAEIQVTEGKVFEIPIGGKSGGVKGTVKLGIGAVVILIDGRGKKTLEFTEDLSFSLPDEIEIEPSVSPGKPDIAETIAGFLPSLKMYKGSIDTKATLLDVVSVPLPDSFNTSYQLQNTKYFMHDDATLTAQAIEAVGRMCAEELAGLSDPNSEVEIYGHTDASGKHDYNLALSAARAANTMQAIEDRLGKKLQAKIKKVSGFGENEANKKFGQYTQKNAWLRRVVVIINGRAVLSLGEI